MLQKSKDFPNWVRQGRNPVDSIGAMMMIPNQLLQFHTFHNPVSQKQHVRAFRSEEFNRKMNSNKSMYSKDQ